MAATQPLPSNLKDRIAALQQRNGSPSPTPSPTSSHRDASITPPRSSLRDKIAKFERKGGVPIPRSSFGMGMPPPEEAGSTKSRELYGNRVAALGKGRPTAPGNSVHRVVTSPAIPSVSPSFRTSPDRNAAQPAAHLTPDSISSASSSTPPSLSSTSEPTDRPDGPIDVGDGSDEAQEIPVQPAVEPQVESLTVTQDAEPLGPSNSATRPTVSIGHRPPADSTPSSPTSLDATTLTRGSISPTPLKATSSNGTPTEAGGLATSIVYEKSPTSSESNTQERPPAATPKSSMSTVQARISVEQVPVNETTTNLNPRGSRLDRPSQNGFSAISSTRSDAPSVTRLPSSSIITSADSLKERSTSITSDAPTPDGIKSSLLPSNNSTSASTFAFPSAISSTVPPVSKDLDDTIRMSPPPVAEPGRRSFSAVVHRGDSDNHSEPRHSTTSRSSTVTPRLSTSSFKTGTDGGVVRSKRNFKHLGAVGAGPPPSPGPGDLSTGELAALLQDAAWLEQQLSDETLALTVPSTLGEEWQKVDMSEPSFATKAAEATTRSPRAAATSARMKGRGLTLGSATSKPPSDRPQSPMRSSPSAPSFQVHTDASPTAPTSARVRKYFSLRGALRGPRLSLSSEMSSDDSALVATPPSPSFDLAMHHSAQHGNDSMSIRSMFSIRSNRSGKSESAHGSLRLSPRRSVARAGAFAGRLLNRATKTKSMLDDPGELPSLYFYYRRADPLLNT
ncbi:hypothetical protein F5888DRAFT_1019087 [Russula emetica]|nr:hypothetical protein F5888DRAFT_1019087 [Russula emetica]